MVSRHTRLDGCDDRQNNWCLPGGAAGVGRSQNKTIHRGVIERWNWIASWNGIGEDSARRFGEWNRLQSDGLDPVKDLLAYFIQLDHSPSFPVLFSSTQRR